MHPFTAKTMLLRRVPFCFVVRRFSVDNLRTGRLQTQVWVEQLHKSILTGNIDGFSNDLKTFSVNNPNAQSLTLLDPLFTSDLIAKLNANLTGQVVWSLGKLGYDAKYSEKRAILCALLNRFVEASKLKVRSSDIAVLWSGLKLVKLNLKYIDSNLRFGLMEVVEKVLPQMTASEISRFLHAALRCGMHWGYFSSAFREKLLSKMIQEGDAFTFDEGSLAFMSLGLLCSFSMSKLTVSL